MKVKKKITKLSNQNDVINESKDGYVLKAKSTE